MAFIFGKDDPRRLEGVWDIHDLREIDDKDSTYKQIAEDLNVEKLVGIPSPTFWHLVRKAIPEYFEQLPPEPKEKAIPEFFEQLPPEPKDLPADSLDYLFDGMWTGWEKRYDTYREGGGKPFTIERGLAVEYPGTEEEYFNTYLDYVDKHPEKVAKKGMINDDGQIHEEDYRRAQAYKEWQENEKAKRKYKDALRRIGGK